MFGWLTRMFRGARQVNPAHAASLARGIKAKYDAYLTNDDNRRHWANADALSANAANSPSVRGTLRNRARYEYANNSYCNGMIRTLAFHCIGTGPRLQLSTGNPDADKRIEQAWNRWCKEIGLASKLSTMRQARCRDGEAFGLFVTNNRLRGPIKLDLRLIEADQVANPSASFSATANEVDGIVLDELGNPVSYTILAEHPGDTQLFSTREATVVPAERVIHLFREDRPGQRRGIPEVTPALPLYAVLRRYTLATLHKAEVAALMAIFLKTTASGIDPADLGDPFEVLDFERNAMTTLPDGWDISQLKAEAPTDAHDSFCTAIMREIARCLDMPRSIAMGDSTGLNYSSGRLDHQTYFRAIEIDRFDFEVKCLDQLFAEWLNEAALVPGLIPDGLELVADWQHDWQWDGFEHVDPTKEANADETQLATGMACHADLLAKQGKDVDTVHAKAAANLGMSIEDYRSRMADKLFGPKPSAPATADDVADEMEVRRAA
jgi:lambda family phage portal protein